VKPLEITVGTFTSLSAFFVVNTSAHYQALLGREWIHANLCVPSTLHPFLLLWKEDDVEIVWADDKPFQTVSDAVDARYYDPNCRPIRFRGTKRFGSPRSLEVGESVFKKRAEELLKPHAIVPADRSTAYFHFG